MILELELITTEDFDKDVGSSATNHVATAGLLDLAKCQLNKAGTVLGRATPKATIDGLTADYDGYADASVTWAGSFRTDDGKLELQGTVPQFIGSDDAPTNMIGSLAIYNTAKSKVYAVANFAGEGVPMASALDALRVILSVRFSGNGKVNVIT